MAVKAAIAVLAVGLAAVAGLVPAAGAAAAESSGPGTQLWVSRYNGLGNGSDGARSVAVSPDGNTVYVTGYTDVSSLNYDYGTVAGSVPVGRQPFIGLAADPRRGIVYVTNEFGDSVSVLVRCQASGG